MEPAGSAALDANEEDSAGLNAGLKVAFVGSSFGALAADGAGLNGFGSDDVAGLKGFAAADGAALNGPELGLAAGAGVNGPELAFAAGAGLNGPEFVFEFVLADGAALNGLGSDDVAGLKGLAAA